MPNLRDFSYCMEAFNSYFFPKDIQSILSIIFSFNYSSSFSLKNSGTYHFYTNELFLSIPECQSGFRKNHSTTISLLHLSDSVFLFFDNNFLSVLVALDFFKAFDTVNYELLTTKLHHYSAYVIPLYHFYVLPLLSFLNKFSFIILFLVSPWYQRPPLMYQGFILSPLLFNLNVAYYLF